MNNKFFQPRSKLEVRGIKYYIRFMKKILLTLIITLFSTNVFALDRKPGRFFEDYSDLDDDYQIYVIYLLGKKEKDKEKDFIGWIEKEVKKINDLMFKMTNNLQSLSLIIKKIEKLYVLFVKMDRKALKIKFGI